MPRVGLALALAPLAAAQPCPNLCNGHGHCKTQDRVCECFDGYMGGDCSEMSCPYGVAWADEATATDVAHKAMECSNRGICDRTTGQCACESARFEGAACERKTCPTACNGHGRCQSMNYRASQRDLGAGTMQLYAYKTVWDAEMMYGCVCDDGYFGPDCTLRACPIGDDPLTEYSTSTSGRTVAQADEQQQIECVADGGTFYLSFMNAASINIPYDADSTAVADAIANIATVDNAYYTSVVVSPDFETVCTSNGNSFAVVFKQNFGDLPSLVPNVDALTSSRGTASVVVSEITSGSKENETCSNRGLCGTDTGVCTCSTGYDTSDGANQPGQRGDCGYASDITDCPGEISCSGNGVCQGPPTYRCDCENGWTGADCSLMTCPRGLSWFDLPSIDNCAHGVSCTGSVFGDGFLPAEVECGDMGICDPTTGICACMDGFFGAACDKMSCPGDPACNDHGTCMSMSELATVAEENGDATAYTYGATPNDAYTWDADRVYGCRCDDGFSGFDCSLADCPMGDDPLTKFQANERQSLTCYEETADDDAAKQLFFTFRQAESAALDYTTLTFAQLEAALEAIDGIDDVSVYSEALSDDAANVAGDTLVCTGYETFVEFLSPTGDLPLLTSKTTATKDVAISEDTKGTKEWITCSGRGLCDTTMGTCMCFTGFGASDNQGGSGTYANCGYHEPIIIL